MSNNEEGVKLVRLAAADIESLCSQVILDFFLFSLDILFKSNLEISLAPTDLYLIMFSLTLFNFKKCK